MVRYLARAPRVYERAYEQPTQHPARGRAQQAILTAIQHAGPLSVPDLARHPALRGVSHGDIARSADALHRRGLAQFDGQVVAPLPERAPGHWTYERTEESRALKNARAQLAAVGFAIQHRPEWDEYRVYRKGDRNPDHGYFTPDLDDALATGLQMARRGEYRAPLDEARRPWFRPRGSGPGGSHAPYYEVVVGNVGNVYKGYDRDEALAAYDEYVDHSLNGYGRAAGETVTLFKDSEIEKEHEGGPYPEEARRRIKVEARVRPPSPPRRPPPMLPPARRR
jgi:hypothetical protein